jgi:hypothetical protein
MLETIGKLVAESNNVESPLKFLRALMATLFGWSAACPKPQHFQIQLPLEIYTNCPVCKGLLRVETIRAPSPERRLQAAAVWKFCRVNAAYRNGPITFCFLVFRRVLCLIGSRYFYGRYEFIDRTAQGQARRPARQGH